jgi:hypothetical protein
MKPRHVLAHPTDAPTTASLMGYQLVVKAGGAPKNIVIERLNAERELSITQRGKSRSERYVAKKSTTQSGKLRKA